MSSLRLFFLTAAAMLAFAANSVLCRLALGTRAIDAASFTTVRLLSAVFALWLLAHFSGTGGGRRGDWPSALALFAYAAGFSFSYLTLPAGTGALVLFGAVQLTMIAAALRGGERPRWWQTGGILLSVGGLIYLVLPGVTAPSPGGTALMAAAGIAWGLYSLHGRAATAPLAETAGNFRRTVPLAVALGLLGLPWMRFEAAGIAYAVLSGALASGGGYALWYAALPKLRATGAATVQLSVPLLAAGGGAIVLGEPITARLAIASAAVLGGIALVFGKPRRSRLRSVPPSREARR